MPKNVKCKNCDKLKNHWCRAVIDSPDEDMVRDCRHFRHKTNGDRIRAMSDEELAEQLNKMVQSCGGCPMNKDCVCDMPCEDAFLLWLKEPAEVDHEPET